MASIRARKNREGKVIGWQAMIRLKDGFPPQSKVFPTKQEAKDWAKQQEAERRLGCYLPNQYRKHTLAELIDRYIAIVLPTHPKNAHNTLRHLNWWKDNLGAYGLNNLSPELIAEHRQKLSQGLTPGHTRRTPATVNRYLAALSVVLSYGVKECGWLRENPMLKITKMKEPPGRDRYLSLQEMQKLLYACRNSKNKYLYPIVLIALTTSMRQGEILLLKWNDIDFERNTISIKKTKNGEHKTTPMVAIVKRSLLKFFEKRNLHSPQIFSSSKCFSKKISIRTAWETALKRADVSNFRFHDLRHTFASYNAQSGATDLQLGAALGNKTAQMVRRYSHMRVEHIRPLSERLESLINLIEDLPPT